MHYLTYYNYMLIQWPGTDLMEATRKRRERWSSTRRRLGAAVAYGTFVCISLLGCGLKPLLLYARNRPGS